MTAELVRELRGLLELEAKATACEWVAMNGEILTGPYCYSDPVSMNDEDNLEFVAALRNSARAIIEELLRLREELAIEDRGAVGDSMSRAERESFESNLRNSSATGRDARIANRRALRALKTIDALHQRAEKAEADRDEWKRKLDAALTVEWECRDCGHIWSSCPNRNADREVKSLKCPQCGGIIGQRGHFADVRLLAAEAERDELREQLAKWNGLVLPDEVDVSPEGVLVFIRELVESDDGACRAWGDANERAEKAEVELAELRKQLEEKDNGS